MALDPDPSRPDDEVTEASHSSIPTLDSISPDAWLLRDRTSKELKARGFKVSASTLATKAARGGGPPFRIFGKTAIYRWGDTVAWVLETMGEPARTTSEHRARLTEPKAPQKPSPDKIAAMVQGSRRYNAARVAARIAARSDIAAQKKAKPKRAQVAAAPPPA